MDDKALQRIDGVIRHINNVQKRLEGITFESFIYLACSSREGNGTPLQYSFLENPMDGGVW